MGLHMLGAALVVVATTAVCSAMYSREPVAAAVLRWPGLPARADDAGAASRRHSAIGTLALLAGVLAVFLLFA